GAEILADRTTHFRVWAPRCRQVELVIPAQATLHGDSISKRLTPEQSGYFSVQLRGLAAGTRYGYRLDGNNQVFPDPASRYQPDGPEGLSQIVDPNQFHWTDKNWR